MERIGVTDSCSELNGPHQRLKEGCEALGWDFKLITRNVDPAKHDPELAGYVGFGDVTGSKLSDPEDLSRRRARARRRPGRQLPRRADPGRGRARRRGGGHLHRPRRRRGPGRGSRARRSSWPAARSSRRRSCGARGSAARPSATTCACIPSARCSPTYEEPQDAWWGPPQSALCHEFAEGRGRPRLPARGRPPLDRDRCRRDALAVRSPAQAGDGPAARHLVADLADPRPRPRTGRRRRGGERRRELPRSPTSSTSPTSAPAWRRWPGSTRRRARSESWR